MGGKIPFYKWIITSTVDDEFGDQKLPNSHRGVFYDPKLPGSPELNPPGFNGMMLRDFVATAHVRFSKSKNMSYGGVHKRACVLKCMVYFMEIPT